MNYLIKCGDSLKLNDPFEPVVVDQFKVFGKEIMEKWGIGMITTYIDKGLFLLTNTIDDKYYWIVYNPKDCGYPNEELVGTLNLFINKWKRNLAANQ